MDLRLLKSLEL